MALIPDFELGLWNAWTILLVYYAVSFVPFFIAGDRAEARMEGETDLLHGNRDLRVAAVVDHLILMPLTLVYSLFVPLERGNWWLCSGLIISAIAVVMALSAAASFATAPVENPITAGAYSVSRHPMYLSRVLVFIGVGLAGTSWVFFACAVIDFVVWSLAVPHEEQSMISKYGASYEDYMQHSQRWIGLPAAGLRRPQRQ